MRVELVGLEGGKGEFAHSYAPGELVLDDARVRLISPPKVSGQIRQEGRRAHVRGRLEARVQVDCDRCLQPVEIPIHSRFKLEYVTKEDYQAQQVDELTEADLDLSIFDGEVIDVDELVVEEIMLAVPDQVLCADNCKGICTNCGVDRNSVDCGCPTAPVDPRWAALRELRTGK